MVSGKICSTFPCGPNGWSRRVHGEMLRFCSHLATVCVWWTGRSTVAMDKTSSACLARILYSSAISMRFILIDCDVNFKYTSNRAHFLAENRKWAIWNCCSAENLGLFWKLCRTIYVLARTGHRCWLRTE